MRLIYTYNFTYFIFLFIYFHFFKNLESRVDIDPNVFYFNSYSFYLGIDFNFYKISPLL